MLSSIDMAVLLPVITKENMPLAEKLADMKDENGNLMLRANEILKLLPVVTKENIPLVEGMVKKGYRLAQIINDLSANSL